MIKLIPNPQTLAELEIEPLENLLYIEIPTLDEVGANHFVNGKYAEMFKLHFNNDTYQEYFILTEEKKLPEAVEGLKLNFSEFSELFELVGEI